MQIQPAINTTSIATSFGEPNNIQTLRTKLQSEKKNNIPATVIETVADMDVVTELTLFARRTVKVWLPVDELRIVPLMVPLDTSSDRPEGKLELENVATGHP